MSSPDPKMTHKRAFAWKAVLVVLVLMACLVASCRPLEPDYVSHGSCAICDGTGRFGEKICPSCQGLGYIRVRYAYPVIEPIK